MSDSRPAGGWTWPVWVSAAGLVFVLALLLRTVGGLDTGSDAVGGGPTATPWLAATSAAATRSSLEILTPESEVQSADSTKSIGESNSYGNFDRLLTAPKESPVVYVLDFGAVAREDDANDDDEVTGSGGMAGVATGTSSSFDADLIDTLEWLRPYRPVPADAMTEGVIGDVDALEAAYSLDDQAALTDWTDEWQRRLPANDSRSVPPVNISGTQLTAQDVAEAAYEIAGLVLETEAWEAMFRASEGAGEIAINPGDRVLAVKDRLLVYFTNDLDLVLGVYSGYLESWEAMNLLESEGPDQEVVNRVAVLLREFRPSVPGQTVYYTARERLALSLFVHRPPPLRDPTPEPTSTPFEDYPGPMGYPFYSPATDEELVEQVARKAFLAKAIELEALSGEWDIRPTLDFMMLQSDGSRAAVGLHGATYVVVILENADGSGWQWKGVADY